MAAGMTEAGPNSIIHKKTRFGREGFDARAMTPAKALRLALAKSADTLFDLALSVITIEQRQIAAQAVAAALGDDGLLILLDGAEAGRGAVKLDRPLITGLIEAQIIGEVRAAEVRPRRFTRTDAAMAAPFLDAVLRGFDEELSGEDEKHRPFALRFGDQMEDARVLSLALEGAEYDLFRVTVDLGVGARIGVITLLLPKRPARKAAGRDVAPDAPCLSGGLARNALDATATLDAVLARLSLPLREICAFEPGTVLTLPAEAIATTELYAPKNHLVAAVRLGQMNGQRAVRLVDGSDGDPLSAPIITGTHDLPQVSAPEAPSRSAVPETREKKARAESALTKGKPAPAEN